MGKSGHISFLRLSPFLSITHRENEITRLFSLIHWEKLFCPFVFNKPSGGTFIFNTSLCWVILGARSRVWESLTGAGLRLAFIALIAYAYWLVLSRDKVSCPEINALRVCGADL